MVRVFADTFYWVAITFPDDQWAGVVARLRISLGKIHILTTEEVLVEFLASLASQGPHVRAQGAKMVYSILEDKAVTVLHQSHASFLGGLRLYERRLDKKYSLVDCISMNSMRAHGIREVLTKDRHFAQEGFTLLVP